MKAILNVNHNSAYSHQNLLTFNVNMIVSENLINLNFKGFTADFSAKEIIVIDFEKEMQAAFDDFNFSGNSKRYNFLKNYQEIHKIKFEPIFNCPA